MIFTVSELLNIENTKGHAAFVSFLCDIQDMNEYGMPYSIEMSSDESGTKINYTLIWSVLTAFKNIIYNMKSHETEKTSLSDLEIDSF